MDYFKDNDAIFFKGNGLLPLLDRIKTDVDKYGSAAFQIDNQFKEELKYLKVFDKQCNANSHQLIRELLIKSREDSLTDTENYLNAFRSEILDKMNAVAAYFGVVPEGLSLNKFSLFLCDKLNKYKLNEVVLPTALHKLMEYVVMMAQDASHGDPRLRYKVRDFISKHKDILIIQSLLFAIIELISWFIPYLANNTDKELNLKKWQRQD